MKTPCTIWPHKILNDWCHLCGRRSHDNADVWYSDNAERGGEQSNYIRICSLCADAIVAAANGQFLSAGPGIGRLPEDQSGVAPNTTNQALPGPALLYHCKSCGEPFVRDKENGTVKRTDCPVCGLTGCTVCVTMTETGTCCCSPE